MYTNDKLESVHVGINIAARCIFVCNISGGTIWRIDKSIMLQCIIGL